MKIEVDKWTLKIKGLKDWDDYNNEKMTHARILMKTYIIILTLLATYDFLYVFCFYYGKEHCKK